MSRIYSKIGFALLGFIIGYLCAIIFPDFFKQTYTYETRENLILDNIIEIPKNTIISKIRVMPEGFTTYALYINIDNWDRKILKLKDVERGVWYNPYWYRPLDTSHPDSTVKKILIYQDE
ncbi:MAG TPA: hypothetical protein PLE74_06100 [Candidatus Cloacimonadota bacterium]|nr:hypothetical protein [Candidatus Cloacimonadota bacterium]